MLGNSAYLFLAKTLGYGIRILLPVFLVRILTKADFGAYNQFFLIEIMFKTVFQMGVNQSQFFFVPRDLRNAGSYFINSLMLNVGLFVVAYSIIGGFRGEVADFLGMEILRELFWPLAIYSLLMMLNVTAETYLVARKLFIQSAVFDILRQVLASAATLAAAYITRDLESIIQALVWSRAVSLVGVLLYIHLKHNGFQSEKYFFGLGKQVKYGLMLGMAGMLWTFLMRMNELTVSRFYDIETYAVYAAG
ncbi:MAG: O-antigen/teichoic acid export membrane protein, partial [Candidatus Krumholzibacteriia bacterium]